MINDSGDTGFEFRHRGTSWDHEIKRKLRQFILTSSGRDLLVLLGPPDGAEHAEEGPRHLVGVRGALGDHETQAVWPATRGLPEGRHWSLHVRWWWLITVITILSKYPRTR